jgi:hypothetical protein
VNTSGKPVHPEAYCLMKYASKDGAEVEWIWNSRDGVTPFVVWSKKGIELQHVQWEFDVRIPNYQPLAGERVFVSVTLGHAELLAKTLVDSHWADEDYPISNQFSSKEEAYEVFTKQYYGDGNQPTVISAAEWQPPHPRPAKNPPRWGGRFA